MAWTGSTVDPIRDKAAADVISAFGSAQNAARPTVECYRAGVAAWRRFHPDQTHQYASLKAVAVILEATVKLRIED